MSLRAPSRSRSARFVSDRSISTSTSSSTRSDLRLWRGAYALVVASSLIGPFACGKADGGRAVHPVEGELFVQDQPAPGALVFLHPIGDPDPTSPRPHGRVDKDGRFTLTTDRDNDGAPDGQYVVTIDWRKEIPGRGPVGPSLLPRQYSTPAESPLKVTVGPETNHLPRITIP